MAEELGLLVDDDCRSPIKRGDYLSLLLRKKVLVAETLVTGWNHLIPIVLSGGVMFTAFCVFGLVPLAGFSLVTWMTERDLTVATSSYEGQMHAFWAAAIASSLTLFFLGAIKVRQVEGLSSPRFFIQFSS